VVLAHGFLRDQQHMGGLAAALAESGIPTLTLSFCNSRFWDGGHGLNALDMRRVADAMGARRLVYAGFSAGGLSALIAARNDPRTVGVLTLDLVDEGGLGEEAARGLTVPMVALVGAPAPCNRQSQGLAVTAANPKSQVIPIAGARHCDFESPTDWLCKTLCAHAEQGSETRRRLIIETSVTAVGRMLGLDESSVGS
jgi:pimeloyl-ACP methyl ester carboxylesterase